VDIFAENVFLVHPNKTAQEHKAAPPHAVNVDCCWGFFYSQATLFRASMEGADKTEEFEMCHVGSGDKPD
jgi:hypothetical protein